jgi:hypothetical protein
MRFIDEKSGVFGKNFPNFANKKGSGPSILVTTEVRLSLGTRRGAGKPTQGVCLASSTRGRKSLVGRGECGGNTQGDFQLPARQLTPSACERFGATTPVREFGTKRKAPSRVPKCVGQTIVADGRRPNLWSAKPRFSSLRPSAREASEGHSTPSLLVLPTTTHDLTPAARKQARGSVS